MSWTRHFGALLCLVVLYVSSYPVALRCLRGNADDSGEVTFVGSASVPGYRPVEWCVDHTGMQKWMLWWARVWRVESVVMMGILERRAR